MSSDAKTDDPPWFNPRLEDVIALPDMYTKLHPTIVGKLRKALVDNRAHQRPKGKKKWEEIVTMNGTRYALECHPDDDGKICMTGARRAHRPR